MNRVRLGKESKGKEGCRQLGESEKRHSQVNQNNALKMPVTELQWLFPEGASKLQDKLGSTIIPCNRDCILFSWPESFLTSSHPFTC